MFYQQKPENVLRLGDVLRGFPEIKPAIGKWYVDGLKEDFRVDIDFSKFSVVVTPCCSIGEEKISLSPLIKIRSSFFDNPFFEEDITRINRIITNPKDAIPPKAWSELTPDDLQRRLSEGPAYALKELFVYEGNGLFPNHTIRRKNKPEIETNHYMMDFRSIFNISCREIESPESYPLGSKLLQLSVETRKDLRDKLADYFGRVPKEDAAFLQ